MVNIEGNETNQTNQGTNEMATATKATKIQASNIDGFYINPENVRNIENYDVANMIAKIAALGKVIVPVFALPPDTEGEFKGKRRIVDGNRRGKSLQIIASRVNALKEGKQDVFDASISTIEGTQGSSAKSLVEAARKFNYEGIDLVIPFIEVSKEQAEDEKEMLKLQLVTGSSAKALTPSEYAAGVLKLLAENDGNEDQTAVDIGKDKVWVQKIARVYVGVNKDEKMLAAIEEGRIDVDLSDQIAAFARKAEMPIGSAVDEVLAAASARNKIKATKKDLDSVKAVHNKDNTGETGGSGGSSGSGGSGGSGETGTGATGSDTKTIRARPDSLDTIRELIKFATQQMQKGFDGYDDEALNALASKADTLHNQMIKLEKAAKEEPKATETAVTPITTVEPAIAETPEIPVTTPLVAPVTEEVKAPVTAQ